MNQLISLFCNNVKIFLATLSGILGIIISIKKIFFSINKDRVLKGTYLHFKTIRKEYSKNKINGYFALQQYFNAKLSTEEMDYILESPDAYKMFFLIKAARGKYEFKNNEFISKKSRKAYILPVIGYFFSFIFISLQLVFANRILLNISTYDFIILLIINLCISIPIFINCSSSINEIVCTRKLCGLTDNKKSKYADNEVTKKMVTQQ